MKKAIQGQIGIYICATDALKIAGNIDSASGSYEKVLRYLRPMMNQLTIPMMIIGLCPFESFKINKKAEIIKKGCNINKEMIGHEVEVTKQEDYSIYKGKLTEIAEIKIDGKDEMQITIQKSKNNKHSFTDSQIKFLEILN